MIIYSLFWVKIRTGFAGEDTPRSIFHNLIGIHNSFPNSVYHHSDNITKFYGNEGYSIACTIHEYRYPIDSGHVTNWDDMEQMWHHTFYNQLQVAPEDYGVS